MCQWKKRYWRVRSWTISSPAAGSECPLSAPNASRIAWVIAVARVTAALGWTNAAHQASASVSGARYSGLSELQGLALLMDVQAFEAVRQFADDLVGAPGQLRVGDRDAGLG